MNHVCLELFVKYEQFVDFFFFQAEDGIRDWSVTGVQTCALPIWRSACERTCDKCATQETTKKEKEKKKTTRKMRGEIGRASCRERV